MRPIFAAASILVFSTGAFASSHREAPFITKNPKVDNTDFYLFNSYEAGRANYVTVISNFQPLQAPYGGPNYFTMDPEALYEIHIDNTGDGVEDLTFQFTFHNDLLNGTGVALPISQPDGGNLQTVPIPLINAAPIGYTDGGAGAGQGLNETYNVGLVRGPRRGSAATAVTNKATGATTFRKPFENVGSKTFPPGTYDPYAQAFIYEITIPGCTPSGTPGNRMFVGTRKEGFAVNLGPIFDLVNAPAAVITDPSLRGAVPNPIAYANVTTIALEIDKSCLNGTGNGGIIGGWSTASLRQARVLNPNATYTTPAREGGPWVQVSRLGMPLVNEVVIGLPDKDLFNSSEPKDDVAHFAKYVFNPTLPALLEILFGTPAPTAIPRLDLVTAFLTGVPGVNAFPNLADGGSPPTEMQRLNTGIPATTAATQNNLGALECFVGRDAGVGPHVELPPSLGGTNASCDPAGFPNGRRPGDDVVDVALRVSMGVLLPNDSAPSGGIPFHDAVLQQSSDFDSTFPYLKNPNPGVP
jgi:hypothetical protein